MLGSEAKYIEMYNFCKVFKVTPEEYKNTDILEVKLLLAIHEEREKS